MGKLTNVLTSCVKFRLLYASLLLIAVLTVREMLRPGNAVINESTAIEISDVDSGGGTARRTEEQDIILSERPHVMSPITRTDLYLERLHGPRSVL